MDRKPNFMLLQGEDAGRHLGCYGDPRASTPRLDGLAAEGARYTNAFTHAPVCSPSRGGMATGRYPYSLGNHHHRSNLVTPPRTFTEELREAGYHVNWNTKRDFNFETRAGWRDTSTDWHLEPAPEQPFFVYENFKATHESRMFPDKPSALEMGIPESREVAPRDPASLEAPPYLTDCPEVRRQLAKYYDAYSVLDAQVGARLRWLEEQGLADNTVVIYLSDHGRGLPREKRWCYDAGLHMPLIVRMPGGVDPGAVIDELVGWVDIAPTLLSLAGVPVPNDYQGRVFLGDGTDPSPRDCAFAGRDRMDEVFDRVRAARDRDWLYIRNYAPELPWAQCQSYMENQEIMDVMRDKHRRGALRGDEGVFFRETKPPEELYDAAKDPDGLRNLAGDPAHAGTLEKMRRRLDRHLEEVGDLGAVTEEVLIERNIVENHLPKYRQWRRDKCDPERILGPRPFPITLREARERRLYPDDRG